MECTILNQGWVRSVYNSRPEAGRGLKHVSVKWRDRKARRSGKELFDRRFLKTSSFPKK